MLLETSKVEYDTELQRASLLFPENLPLSDVVISMIFGGTITDELCGFYRSKYKSEGSPPAETPSHDGYSYMYSTQFEACDARKAFPCFDEPNLKTTFDIDIEIPSTLTALSNMPVKSSKAGKTEGLKVVSFETTPKMSTYVSCSARLPSPSISLLCSSRRGLLETLSTWNRSQTGSTTELKSPFESIAPEA